MSRTRRKYNFPNKIFYVWDTELGWIPDWHPWHEWECTGNRKIKKYLSKQRRAKNKVDLRRQNHEL